MKKWWYILALFVFVNCRESYNVFPPTDGDGVLVVEGILNANGRTVITLSRTSSLSNRQIIEERNAVLAIEEELNGAIYPMIEREPGVYESEELVFDAANRYRLRINTDDSRQYATDFKNVLITPPLDSLSWHQDEEGVKIFAHSHSDVNASRFFKWEYEEDWEFHSSFRTFIKFTEVLPGPTGNRYVLDYRLPVSQSVDTTLFNCWDDRLSTGINLVSTDALGSNVLFYPVKNYPKASIELSVLYSILLKQYALSLEAHEFYTRMKKNTESLGSIFDALPSEIAGNVRNQADPSEPVIGYIECTTLQSRRIFIRNDELNEWGYNQGCLAFHEPDQNFSEYPYPNNPDLFNDIVERDLVPTVSVETEFGAIKTFRVERARCVDCRLRSTKQKPDFWP